jgi:hypothetical protein
MSDRSHGSGGSTQSVPPSSLVRPLKTSNCMDGKGWYTPARLKRTHVLSFPFDLTKEVRALVGESCAWRVEPSKSSMSSISGWVTIEIGLTDTPGGPKVGSITAIYEVPG